MLHTKIGPAKTEMSNFRLSRFFFNISDDSKSLKFFTEGSFEAFFHIDTSNWAQFLKAVLISINILSKMDFQAKKQICYGDGLRLLYASAVLIVGDLGPTS